MTMSSFSQSQGDKRPAPRLGVTPNCRDNPPTEEEVRESLERELEQILQETAPIGSGLPCVHRPFPGSRGGFLPPEL